MADKPQLPQEWTVKTIDALGRVLTGKTPSTRIAGNFGGHIPFITPSDMDGRRVIAHTARYLTEQGAASVSSARIPKGTVMVSCIGSDMGKAAIAGCDAVTNQQINSIIVGEGISNLYVYYNLSTRKSEIQHIGSGGSAVPILNKGHFSQLQIALPLFKEQQAIACILGALDDKIELNRRMNRTLEAMARAIFKSWFVDFDPVRARAEGRDPGLPQEMADLFPDSFEDCELGEIPKGWQVGTLGDAAMNPRRGVQPSEIDPSTPYIALQHMPKRCIAPTDWGTADGLESNKFEFKKGEILFGKLRPYFHKVGVAPVEGVCSTDIVVVTSRTPKWFGFVLGHVSSSAFVEYTNAGSTGTKMPRTSWGEMARYAVVMPPESVAQAFTKRIRPQVDRIIASIHESRTLAAIRDALLPKLLSGEIRARPTVGMRCRT